MIAAVRSGWIVRIAVHRSPLRRGACCRAPTRWADVSCPRVDRYSIGFDLGWPAASRVLGRAHTGPARRRALAPVGVRDRHAQRAVDAGAAVDGRPSSRRACGGSHRVHRRPVPRLVGLGTTGGGCTDHAWVPDCQRVPGAHDRASGLPVGSGPARATDACARLRRCAAGRGKVLQLRAPSVRDARSRRATAGGHERRPRRGDRPRTEGSSSGDPAGSDGRHRPGFAGVERDRLRPSMSSIPPARTHPPSRAGGGVRTAAVSRCGVASA